MCSHQDKNTTLQTTPRIPRNLYCELKGGCINLHASFNFLTIITAIVTKLSSYNTKPPWIMHAPSPALQYPAPGSRNKLASNIPTKLPSSSFPTHTQTPASQREPHQGKSTLSQEAGTTLAPAEKFTDPEMQDITPTLSHSLLRLLLILILP